MNGNPYVDPDDEYVREITTEPLPPVASDLATDPRCRKSASYCDDVGDFFIASDQLTPSGDTSSWWCNKPGDWFGPTEKRWFRSEHVQHGEERKRVTTVWRRIL